MTEAQLRALDAVLDKLFAPTEAGRWLEAQTPVIAKWKAEDAAIFKKYCEQRDMGIKPENLTRFFAFAHELEPRYLALRRVA